MIRISHLDASLFGLALAALGAGGCSKGSAATTSDAAAAAASGATATAGSGLAATAGPLGHPCGLLDASDVEAALGTKGFAPEETPARDPGGDAHCTWHVPGGGGFVEILLHHPTHADRFDHTAMLMKRVPASGIGDKAYVDPGMKWGHVDVLKGAQTFMLQVERGNVATGHKGTREEMQASAESLARKVAAKL